MACEAEESRARCTVSDAGLYLPPGYECFARAAGEDMLPERTLTAWMRSRDLDPALSGGVAGTTVRVWNGTDSDGPRGALRNWLVVAEMARWSKRSAC